MDLYESPHSPHIELGHFTTREEDEVLRGLDRAIHGEPQAYNAAANALLLTEGLPEHLPLEVQEATMHIGGVLDRTKQGGWLVFDGGFTEWVREQPGDQERVAEYIQALKLRGKRKAEFGPELRQIAIGQLALFAGEVARKAAADNEGNKADE
jgi:hypothetical protein